MNSQICLAFLLVLQVQSLTVHGGTDDITGQVEMTDIPQGQIMMMTEVNVPFIKRGFLENWLFYAKPYLNSSMQLVFDPEDAEARYLLGTLGRSGVLPSNTLVLDENYSLQSLTSLPNSFVAVEYDTAAKYGTRRYKDLMNRRPHSTELFLKADKVVLRYDLDTVWRKDPFEKFNEAGVHDLLAIWDQPAVQKYCGCLSLFRPTAKSKKMVRLWADISDHDYAAGNQYGYNHAIKNSVKGGRHDIDFDVFVLSHDDFPGGVPSGGKKPLGGMDMTILHANFIKGEDRKIAALKGAGYWHVNTPVHVEPLAM